MSLRFIHVVAYGRTSFFFKAEWYWLCVYSTFSLSIYLLMAIWAAPTSWPLWTTLRRYTEVCSCVSEVLLSSLPGGYSEVGLPGHIVLFVIFWGPSILFSISAVQLSFHQLHVGPSFPHQSSPSLLISGFSIEAILMGEIGHLVVLICISLMIDDVEHLFICFLVLYLSSLEKCLSPLPIVKNQVTWFYVVEL